MQLKRPETTALVLSGGGARGAYEAGILDGIRIALELRPGDPSPMRIFSGSSVGAINAAHLAAHADQGDLGLPRLLELWHGLRIETHLRVLFEEVLGRPLLELIFGRAAPEPSVYLGRSLLDPRPLEALVTQSIPWSRLHQNARSGALRALLIAALHVGSGRTTVFAELPEGQPYRPSPDPNRVARPGPIGPAHVLASAAIPFVFPARWVGDSYYCDGGLRSSTPIAPALRTGATRLVVVSVLHRPPLPSPAKEAENIEHYPNPLFLAGKVLNALLLDPVVYDLAVLERLNRLLDVLERSLEPEALEGVRRLLAETRGIAYRKVETLSFFPSEDLGALAADFIRRRLPGWRVGRAARKLLGRASARGATWEADWASYLLFDGAYTEALIELGRRDALRRRAEIRAYFLESAC